jgi:hypothetical protein
VLPASVRLDWKVIARYKHSILFGLVVSNGGKKFYNIDAWPSCFKTFFPSWLMPNLNKLACSRLANFLKVNERDAKVKNNIIKYYFNFVINARGK